MAIDKDILEQLKKLNSALENYLDNQDMDEADEEEEEDVKKSRKPCDKED